MNILSSFLVFMGTCAFSRTQSYGSQGGYTQRYSHLSNGNYYYPSSFNHYGTSPYSRYMQPNSYGYPHNYGTSSPYSRYWPNSNSNNGGSRGAYSDYMPRPYSSGQQNSGRNGGQSSSSYSKYIPNSYKHYWSNYNPMSMVALDQAPDAGLTTLVGSMSFVPDFASSFVPSFGSGSGYSSMMPSSYSMGGSMMPYNMGGGYSPSPMSYMCSFCSGSSMNPFSMYECPPWCMRGGYYPY